jgi:RsiW-degrading membrane proteinase PrsW (M82 family)
MVVTADFLITIIILIAAAFVPPVIYVIWLRNKEKYEPNPWSKIARTFINGAFIAVAIALIMHSIAEEFYQTVLMREYEYLAKPSIKILIFVCIVAPFVEEFAKCYVVYSARKAIKEPEDGLIYGAAVGLGFAATENLMYEGYGYFTEGLKVFILIMIIRSISSTLLHGSATAFAGYGIAKNVLSGQHYHILPYFFGAVGLHALFNLFAAFGIIYKDTLGIFAYLVGFVGAICIAIVAITYIKTKIETLDQKIGVTFITKSV